MDSVVELRIDIRGVGETVRLITAVEAIAADLKSGAVSAYMGGEMIDDAITEFVSEKQPEIKEPGEGD